MEHYEQIFQKLQQLPVCFTGSYSDDSLKREKMIVSSEAATLGADSYGENLTKFSCTENLGNVACDIMVKLVEFT